MKQQINLLSGVIRPGNRGIAARHAVALALSVAVVAVALGGFREWRVGDLGAQSATLTIQIEGLTIDLAERSSLFAVRDADPALLAELRGLEREATDKHRVLEALTGDSIGNVKGFSAHLEALGRRHPEGLWLVGVVLADGGGEIRLQGRALTPALVPELLQALESEPAFAGTTFASLTIDRPDGGGQPVNFALATACLAASGHRDRAECTERAPLDRTP